MYWRQFSGILGCRFMPVCQVGWGLQDSTSIRVLTVTMRKLLLFQWLSTRAERSEICFHAHKFMSISEGSWAALDSSGFSTRNWRFIPKLQNAWKGFGLEGFGFLLFASVLDFCGFFLCSLVWPRPTTSGHLEEKSCCGVALSQHSLQMLRESLSKIHPNSSTDRNGKADMKGRAVKQQNYENRLKLIQQF